MQQEDRVLSSLDIERSLQQIENWQAGKMTWDEIEIDVRRFMNTTTMKTRFNTNIS